MDRGAGGLQSMGLKRVRHDLATKQQQQIYIHSCEEFFFHSISFHSIDLETMIIVKSLF